MFTFSNNVYLGLLTHKRPEHTSLDAIITIIVFRPNDLFFSPDCCIFCQSVAFVLLLIFFAIQSSYFFTKLLGPANEKGVVQLPPNRLIKHHLSGTGIIVVYILLHTYYLGCLKTRLM